jgi:putative transposase
MPNYRRAVSFGGTFFFTQVSFDRAPFLCDESARNTLRDVIEQCRRRWPLELEAMVLLPDHLHAMWTLPDGDSDYSMRWGWLKKTFTQQWLAEGGHESITSPAKVRDGRRGVWQPRFFEHTIRDDDDFNEHLNYIHYNPVKHGLVQCPHQWPYSTFRKWVGRGMYDHDWQCTCGGKQPDPPTFERLSDAIE